MEQSESDKIVAAAIDWFRAGEALSAAKGAKEKLEANRRYTITQLELRRLVKDAIYPPTAKD